MPTLTQFDVGLLAEINKAGGAVFNPILDGGRLRIGENAYTNETNPDKFVAFLRLQDLAYISSESGAVFKGPDRRRE